MRTACGAGTARETLPRTRGTDCTTTPPPTPDTLVPGKLGRGLKAPSRARHGSAARTRVAKTSELMFVTLGTSLQERRQLAHGHVGSLHPGPLRRSTELSGPYFCLRRSSIAFYRVSCGCTACRSRQLLPAVADTVTAGAWDAALRPSAAASMISAPGWRSGRPGTSPTRTPGAAPITRSTRSTRRSASCTASAPGWSPRSARPTTPVIALRESRQPVTSGSVTPYTASVGSECCKKIHPRVYQARSSQVLWQR